VNGVSIAITMIVITTTATVIDGSGSCERAPILLATTLRLTARFRRGGPPVLPNSRHRNRCEQSTVLCELQAFANGSRIKTRTHKKLWSLSS
jgi:hypothetical protein